MDWRHGSSTCFVSKALSSNPSPTKAKKQTKKRKQKKKKETK
jgi:hypothetical protein